MEIALYHIVSLAVLFSIYEFGFSKTKRFKLNRFILMVFPIIPLLLHGLSYSPTVKNEVVNLNPIQLDEIVVSNTGAQESIFSIFDFYLIGIGIVFSVILIQYLLTIRKIKNLNFKKDSSYGVNLSIDKEEENFSFFNYIVLKKEDRMIFSHELCHVKSKHSIDILIYNFYKVFFWFNPFVFLLERKLKLNHEYEADQFASKEDQKAYANELLNQVFGTSSIQFINQFNNQNSIKMRIKILKQSKKGSWFKYFALLPLFGALFVFGAWESENSILNNMINIDGDGDKVYDEVDKMPEFKGGMEGLMKYMQTNVKYPKVSEKDNVEGKVFVEFVVSSNGKISNCKIIKSADKNLDKEALRVIKSMPNWIPGEKNGKNVSVKMVLPIVFKLE